MIKLEHLKMFSFLFIFLNRGNITGGKQAHQKRGLSPGKPECSGHYAVGNWFWPTLSYKANLAGTGVADLYWQPRFGGRKGTRHKTATGVCFMHGAEPYFNETCLSRDEWFNGSIKG